MLKIAKEKKKKQLILISSSKISGTIKIKMLYNNKTLIKNIKILEHFIINRINYSKLNYY